ncbi:MAG: hypothetical protein KF708_03485 [Pirellulales bacterium]|nr:hypothetical protein [Pirellulales bacterium]
MPLEREEYVEQAYFFRTLAERISAGLSVQELLGTLREEVLATTKLPMAIDFLAAELKFHGVFGTAMAKLGHYFTPFQTFLVVASEDERARFDFRTALDVLAREAKYRAEGATIQGIFLFQFETLSRNRLGYDAGLDAVAKDPIFDAVWREWIHVVRRQIGIIDFADLLYVRSQHYVNQQRAQGLSNDDSPAAVLFGEKEGQIALANRRKDPLLLFAALERHLGYPTVPRPKPEPEERQLLPSLVRRIERLESRLRLIEEEQQKGGIDLSKFYQQGLPPEAE